MSSFMVTNTFIACLLTPSCLLLFTGMEVTAYLAEKASSISCIDITAVPFERVLGAPVGKMLQSVSNRKMFTTFQEHVPNSQGYNYRCYNGYAFLHNFHKEVCLSRQSWP